ncbi:MAG: ankyrin repeat domain-containing protein [Epsilonproteobacteria bacterium]|nr:ankyrin repeat domain-containing protein [Campylobacterota bacterium]
MKRVWLFFLPAMIFGSVGAVEDKFDMYELHSATRNGNWSKVKELVRDYSPNSINDEKQTALHIAALYNQLDAARSLFSDNENVLINVDAVDNFGKTPLHYAAEKGHEDLVKILLIGGADTEKKDGAGKTPKQLANGKPAILALLADPTSAHAGDDLQTLINVIVASPGKALINDAYRQFSVIAHPDREGGSKELFSLIQERRKKRLNLLSDESLVQEQVKKKAGRAGEQASKETVRASLERELGVKRKNLSDIDLLRRLVQSTLPNERKKQLIEQATAVGFDATQQDETGKNLLDYAINAKNHEMVNYLLWKSVRPARVITDQTVQKMVDTNKIARAAFRVISNDEREHYTQDYFKKIDVKGLQDYKGSTLLHHALEHVRLSVVTILLNLGARIYVKDGQGRTPWDLTTSDALKRPLRDNLNQQLLYAIEDNDVPAVDYLLGLGATIKTAGVLHTAIDQDNLAMFKHLLEKGASRNGSRSDLTVLQYLVLKDKGTWAEHILNLDLPADINLKNKAGDTALHNAVRQGKPQFIRLFLSQDRKYQSSTGQPKHNKVNLVIQNAAGKTVLELLDEMNGKILPETWNEMNQLLRPGSSIFAKPLSQKTGVQMDPIASLLQAIKLKMLRLISVINQ